MNRAFHPWLPAYLRHPAPPRVGGIPELLDDPLLGRLTPRGDVGARAAALETELASPPRTDAIARHAQRYSWPDTARAYHDLLVEFCAARNRAA
jgi:glycosyltransferase involved in cell wall biosynthesis